ncbi:MAG: DUF4037 domain-containing protein [Butyrivibrio sp.]|nr:DUF4037 domain-containing protein [Butyrivibrio sp.]
MTETIARSRRFYDNKIAPMIRMKFSEYESEIAVGLAGEGSDCFGYDDFMSRDHDFGTGVCLWLTEDDFHKFGRLLSIAYNEIVDSIPGANLTRRLSERRGVMTINSFYSNILGTEVMAENGIIVNRTWRSFDHSCMATAVNGEVFRDDKGVFSAFRNSLLSYYPENIWRERLASEIHAFSSSLQVNYSRCMARKDTVAAEICKVNGIKAAMEIFFLLRRVYPPYYKWTFRALTELDHEGSFSRRIKELSQTLCGIPAWEHIRYMPDNLNMSDKVVVISEQIAERIRDELISAGLIDSDDPYLEKHVDTILNV